ncbi:hypothetical protein, partial [Bacillus sp. WP8]|uniref:hypothetical protein n=1 Tax=Bacillus sp. WP8 TaxID=756828 RepID=UPI0037BF403F
HDNVTQASTVAIDYAAPSSNPIQTISLPNPTLHKPSNLFIIHHFIKPPATINPIINFLHQFNANVPPIPLLLQHQPLHQPLLHQYVSFLNLSTIHINQKII